MDGKMYGIHTHYDNLRVSRDAHPKIIRAAYKKLSHQYHPDHNQNNPEATRAMQVINLAYDVLSDPVRRKEHDEWIARMEAEQQESPDSAYDNPPFNYAEPKEFRFGQKGVFPFTHVHAKQTENEQKKNSFTSSIDKKALGEHFFKHWFWYVLTIATIIGFGYHSYSRSAYNPFMTSSQQYQIHARHVNGALLQANNIGASADGGKSSASRQNEMPYVRPANAPNGQAWPVAASYLGGFEQAYLNGLSSINIENNRNDSDVLVKLFVLESGKHTALGSLYIPAQASFKLEKLPPGFYDIRFLDLKSGLMLRTEPFELQESALASGSRHTVVNMKLNHFENGQPALQKLKQEDF